MLTRNFLIQYYSEKKLSPREVSQIAGCKRSNVWEALSRFNIPIRAASLRQRGRKLTDIHKRHLSLRMHTYLSNPVNHIKHVNRLLKYIDSHSYKTGRIKLLNKYIYYRSSYELIGLKLLKLYSKDLTDIENEKIKIPYISIDQTPRLAVPDWLITLKNTKKYLIDVKPSGYLSDPNTKLKFEATKEWAIRNNITYCLWTESILFDKNIIIFDLDIILERTTLKEYSYV